jgi:hypothetical protein
MAELRMFDKKNIRKHIPPELKYRERLYDLKEVEEYFIIKCRKAGIEWSHDCTAEENAHFKTLNYTTYAGMFIMHPLQFSLQMFQMYDAKADRMDDAGHIDWIRGNLKSNQMSKYTKDDGREFECKEYKPFTHIAVLAGSNKFHQHTSRRKFDFICDRYRSKLLIKPHPISNDGILNEIRESKGMAQMASNEDDLYTLIGKAETVFTTHISETALTSLVLGKKVSPLDPQQSRLIGAFSHINHFCFTEDQPLEVIGSILASPKSGIVHPAVDGDWKGKIDDYFDYIMGKRKIQKNHYFE